MSSEETEDKCGRAMPKGVRDGMIKVSGKDYLPVPFRLLWLRSEKPLWGIQTEIIEAAGFVLVKATVTDETGRVIASAHKACTNVSKFPPVEKAETGAMGRALGAAGFGTQFGELDEEEPGVMGGIADSPVSRTRSNAQVQAGVRPPNVDANGEIHDGVPSRPPLSTLQQAQANFRSAARGIDERFGHASFSVDDMARMVAAICKDPSPLDIVKKYVDGWTYATNILRSFRQQFPTVKAQDIMPGMQERWQTDMPMADFTWEMWADPFPPAAGSPNSAIVDAASRYQTPETAGAR